LFLDFLFLDFLFLDFLFLDFLFLDFKHFGHFCFGHFSLAAKIFNRAKKSGKRVLATLQQRQQKKWHGENH
jgi:hypothetical protein